MNEQVNPEVDQLAQRVAELRSNRDAGVEDSRALLDALFTEYELAEEELRVAIEELNAKSTQMSERQRRSDRERRLLRQVFTHAPVAVFLLDREGAVRRANQQAARLFDTSPTYLNGKPVLAFVDMASRATFRSRLSAALRGTDGATFDSCFSRGSRHVHVSVRLARVDSTEDTPTLAMVAEPAGAGGMTGSFGDAAVGEGGTHTPPAKPALWNATHHLRVMTGMTRLLLDEESLHEPVALGRAARLLRTELADWAVVDLLREGQPQRAAVAGRDGEARTNALEELSPADSPALANVWESASSTLYPSIEDERALGDGPDGRPLLTALGAGSMLCVPLLDDVDGVLGVITLVRRAGRDCFDMGDLGLMEEVGEHLGLALRMGHSYQRNNDAARTLQASLLPRSPLSVPGVEIATTYRPATETGVGGDFYDVFEASDGYGFVLGDVCGKGEEAAMVAAAARNWVQLLGLSEPDPADTLGKVNHALLAHQGGARFVTALGGRLWPAGEHGSVRVRVSSAGHPHALLLRADGSTRFLDGGGLPLGLFPDAGQASEDAELAPGDTLLLYSDGVTETRSPDGDLYGEARLADVAARSVGLPPTALIKEVEVELKAYGSGRAYDDVAMLAFRAGDRAGDDPTEP